MRDKQLDGAECLVTPSEPGGTTEFPRAPRDEEEREAVEYTGELCSAEAPDDMPGACTRQPGHSGDHVSAQFVWPPTADHQQHIVARWPQSAPAEPPPAPVPPVSLVEAQRMARSILTDGAFGEEQQCRVDALANAVLRMGASTPPVEAEVVVRLAHCVFPVGPEPTYGAGLVMCGKPHTRGSFCDEHASWQPPPTPPAEVRRLAAGSPAHVALWDAINAYAETCGGDPSRHVYGNTRRQRAVVEVETAFRAALAAACGSKE